MRKCVQSACLNAWNTGSTKYYYYYHHHHHNLNKIKFWRDKLALLATIWTVESKSFPFYWSGNFETPVARRRQLWNLTPNSCPGAQVGTQWTYYNKKDPLKVSLQGTGQSTKPARDVIKHLREYDYLNMLLFPHRSHTHTQRESVYN